MFTIKTVSVVNLKGGSGKTTTAVHLAHGLAMKGKKTLLIDLEPRAGGDVSNFFSLADQDFFNVGHVFNGKVGLSGAMIQVQDNLTVVPSTEKLFDIDYSLKKVNILKSKLKDVKGYDYCIIDCAGTFNNVVRNAIAASNVCLIPAKLEEFDLLGLNSTVMNMHEFVKQNKLRVKSYVVPMMHKSSLLIRKNGIRKMKAQYKDILMPKVRESTEVPKAMLVKKTVFETNPKHAVTKDFNALINRVLKI